LNVVVCGPNEKNISLIDFPGLRFLKNDKNFQLMKLTKKRKMILKEIKNSDYKRKILLVRSALKPR